MYIFPYSLPIGQQTGVVSKHTASLNKLKSQDPEFYKFLQEEDESLLKFGKWLTLLSTGWFQEQILAWFHNETKINWGPYGRLTLISNKPSLYNIVKTKSDEPVIKTSP